MLSKHNWLTGTLELASKVRYGLTSRGVPRFRFVPYDRRFPPFAVGCTSRDLFYNVHAVAEPTADGKTGILVQNLGRPTLDSELEVLLGTYAYDSQKELRKFPSYTIVEPDVQGRRLLPPETTFHIDPPGCRDVDDSLTFVQKDGHYEVYINIADVDEWVPYWHPLRKFAEQRATSFYTPDGQARCPMFPPELSEQRASLLPSPEVKPTVSLKMLWTPGSPPQFQGFHTLSTQTTKSYTYDEAEAEFHTGNSLMILLHNLVNTIDPTAGNDSHAWISTLMIYYNCQAAKLLHEQQVGILRRSAPAKEDKLKALEPLLIQYPDLKTIAFEAAEFCNSVTENVQHSGLGKEVYCYATSPLRRYADLVNQQMIKGIIWNTMPAGHTSWEADAQLAEHLNRRQRQAKAFAKDLFYATALGQSPSTEGVEGVIVCQGEKGTRVYVPAWKRFIWVKTLDSSQPKAGTKVTITWYEEKSQVRWKERVVFSSSITSATPTE